MMHDGARWCVDLETQKYDVAPYRAAQAQGIQPGTTYPLFSVAPRSLFRSTGNILTIGGADLLWLGLRTGLSGTSGLANTRYDNTNAGIIVGDSTQSVVNTRTEVAAATGATHRYTKGMDATYPTHTTGTGSSTTQKILYRATFSSSQANFAWKEWGIKNRVQQSLNSGRLLNYNTTAQGTKVSTAIWQFTITLSLA